MTRLSISFTDKNSEWLDSSVATGEFASKSEAVNHYIRLARAAEAEDEFIRDAIKVAEASGLETRSFEQIERDVMTRLGLVNED